MTHTAPSQRSALSGTALSHNIFTLCLASFTFDDLEIQYNTWNSDIYTYIYCICGNSEFYEAPKQTYFCRSLKIAIIFTNPLKLTFLFLNKKTRLGLKDEKLEIESLDTLCLEVANL